MEILIEIRSSDTDLRIKSPGICDYTTSKHESGDWSQDSINFELEWRQERYQKQGYTTKVIYDQV